MTQSSSHPPAAHSPESRSRFRFLRYPLALLLGGSLVGFSLFLFVTRSAQEPVPPAVFLNGVRFSLEIAATPETRARGLGGREKLCRDCGMLFVFQTAAPHTFWMKDMRFPLDILWLRDQRVVSLERNVPPDYSGILVPPEAADQVLEVNAGAAAAIQVGQRLEFTESASRPAILAR